MSFALKEIKEAKQRISPYVLKTPLLRMPVLDAWLGCEVYAKVECMQTTGAFKLRGAFNKLLSLTPEQLRCGVVTASTGNHGRAMAYAAKMLGAKATVVMPRTAPQVKIDAVRALGAEVVLCGAEERFDVAERIRAESSGTMVPPYNDDVIMAGQGTLGLEIIEQQPDLDAVVVPVGGGGLISGIATAVKETSPRVRVYGADPAVLPAYAQSLKAGKMLTLPFSPTVAEALLCQTPGDKCFPCLQKYVDAVYSVSEAFILKGMKLLLTEGKILAEASSCIGIGAAMEKLLPVAPKDKVCFVISGGSVGVEQLRMLEEVEL